MLYNDICVRIPGERCILLLSGDCGFLSPLSLFMSL